MDIKLFYKVEVTDKDSEYHYWIGVVVAIDSDRRIYTVVFPDGRRVQFDKSSIEILATTWRQ